MYTRKHENRTLNTQDDGDCSFLFTDAGAQALIPCTCRPMNWANTGGRANEGCRWTDGKKGSESDTDCFGSSCDWHSYAPGCDPVKEELAKCPYFDATVYASLTAIPGLVYLKEGAEREGGGGGPGDMFSSRYSPAHALARSYTQVQPELFFFSQVRDLQFRSSKQKTVGYSPISRRDLQVCRRAPQSQCLPFSFFFRRPLFTCRDSLPPTLQVGAATPTAGQTFLQ